MIQLTFNVNVQQLTRTDTNKVVSDSINQYEAVFTFDEWWDGYTPTAQFTKDGTTKDCVLVDSKCTVPHEVLVGGGILHVNVFSTDGEGGRKTVEDVHILVEQGGYTPDGSHSQPPTPSVYEMLLKATRPPVVGENGNWYVFLNGEYIDSGVQAQGKQGDQGVQGEAGIVMQPDEPENKNVIWIDTDDPDGNGVENLILNVYAEVDLQTLTVKNIDHYSEEIIKAINTGKMVMLHSSILGANISTHTLASVINENTVFSYPTIRTNVGQGMKNYMFEIIISTNSASIYAHAI